MIYSMFSLYIQDILAMSSSNFVDIYFHMFLIHVFLIFGLYFQYLSAIFLNALCYSGHDFRSSVRLYNSPYPISFLKGESDQPQYIAKIYFSYFRIGAGIDMMGLTDPLSILGISNENRAGFN